MATTAGGLPYVEPSDLVSGWPAVSQDLAEELDSQLAAKAALAGATYTGTHDFTGATVTGVGAGLTLVATATASAAGSISVNSCFTSTFDHYLIMASIVGSVGLNLGLKMRLSGTDDSTASSYVRQVLSAENATLTANRAAATTSMECGIVRSTLVTGFAMTLFNPAKATATAVSVQNLDPANGGALYWYGGTHNVATAFDGFSLIASGGTITGTFRIYGYKNS